MQMFADFLVNV